MTQADQPIEGSSADQRRRRRSLSLGVAVVLLGILLNGVWLLVLLWLCAYAVHELFH